ncbi:hypothetical protein Dsin_027626 [Dipteronia sinensis]|uniref:Uncharacterized protein n=1 Tax=Dipteronia sinensis TaxID=43782 RepID=A0AAE0DTN0_9ROSI|nr:hypothetical protein Dsin_027626 [Dipteronia sinensis]
MGCCVSVDDSEASELQKKKEKNGFFSHESRAPPPSAEEETVKEVLSETPKPNSKPEAVLVFAGGDVKQEVEEETKPVFATKIQENHLQLLHNHRRRRLDHHRDDVEENVKRQEVETNEENMSEVSEICSLSMSMSERSVSTTTVTDKRDNDDDEYEVRQIQQRVSRSPAKLPARNREYGVRRDRVVGQSPSRRSEQSPGKRSFNNNNGSARLVQSSSRGGSMPDPRRKDPGECSGRRSRSPATTRSATMNRSPSTRRTTQSPGRVRTDPNESASKKVEGKWPINHNQNNNKNNNKCSSTNESLENPLVSLECFIFL